MGRHGWTASTAVVATLALSQPASAGIDAWTAGDQPGGSLSAIALIGQDALAGTNGGGAGGILLRSADGGASWQHVEALDYHDVYSVAIDPTGGQPWYAATRTGLFRSTDAGHTWAEVVLPPGPGATYHAVAVDRGTPGTAYVLSGATAYRTTTGGSGPWTDVSSGLPASGLANLVVDPVTHFAWGFRYASGVYTLAGGATTWGAGNSGLPNLFVTGLALDGSGSRRMIAGTESGLAWLPAGGGSSWQPLNDGLTGTPPVNTLTGDGAGAAYFTTTDRIIRRLAPGGTTWAPVPVGGRPADYAEGVVGDPTAAGHVAALTASETVTPNLGFGPLWRTLDAGTTWTRARDGIRAVDVKAVAVDPRAAGHVVVATRTDAVQRSLDGGATWLPGATGLPRVRIDAIAADGSGGTFYAGVPQNGVYRSTDGGATWAQIGNGDPVNPEVMAGSPARPGTVYAGEGSLTYKSTDSGDSWAQLPPLPGDPYTTDLTPDTAQPGAVYAAGSKGVFYLPEGAPAWQDRSGGLGTLYVTALAVDPRNPAQLFAATSGGIYRSTDSGGSWGPATGGIAETFLSAVAVDPQVAGTVYAAGLTGVWRSTDDGASWTLFGGGIPLPGVLQLAFDADGRTLYGGTATIGVVARTRPAQPGFGPGPGPAADTAAPVLSRVSLTHRRFRIGRRATAISARAAPRGTTVRFTLSEAATVKFALKRETRTRRGKLKLKAAGTLTRAMKDAGAKRLVFSGRLGKRALKPGRYRMTLTATDTAGNRSKSRVLKLRIVLR